MTDGRLHKILVLAPHVDDVEFGCGGTVARFIDQGAEVHYVAFSVASKSVRTGLPGDILAREAKLAARELGIDWGNVKILDLPVREFPAHRQEILEELIRVREELHPSWVLLPASSDVHQDHRVIHEEGVRAFKRCTILAYEEPWNSLEEETRGLIPIEPEHLERKLRAVACYQSQDHRAYADPEFIRGLARVRGVQAGSQFAEAFEVIRWVVK